MSASIINEPRTSTYYEDGLCSIASSSGSYLSRAMECYTFCEVHSHSHTSGEEGISGGKLVMAGRQRLPAAAVSALLLLWIFSCDHVEASIDFANMTALEKHVEFFDRDKDGIITASEIFEGYVAIGCDAAFARASAASISAGVGPITSPVEAPLPHLSIYIEYIHRAMHGSDTGAYDAKGRFVPEKFEEIFTKHAKVRPDALTSMEIEEMILANRDPLDPQSWGAPEGEWGLIYKLASDKQGFLHKDSARGATSAPSRSAAGHRSGGRGAGGGGVGRGWPEAPAKLSRGSRRHLLLPGYPPSMMQIKLERGRCERPPPPSFRPQEVREDISDVLSQ